ncbi:MAG: S8 family serine peptidase [Bacteriovoracia bacterium]
MRLLLFTIFLVQLGCNPAKNSAPPGVPTAPVAPSEAASGTRLPGWSFPESTTTTRYAFMGLDFSHQVLSDLTGGGWVLSYTNRPAWLTGTIMNGVVRLSGRPEETNRTYNVQVRATRLTEVRQANFTLIVRGDLLRPYQWHLENDGESFFSRETSVSADEDLDVGPVWRRGIFGQGVRIAVSDEGLETAHEDLAVNLLNGEHRNYKTGRESAGFIATPSPAGDAHGTAVTGIIAGVGWNNIGVTGVAPQARVAGFQFLDSLQTLPMLLSQASGDFDIFNFSYGTAINADFPDNPVYVAHLRDRVTRGRQGLGQIFVKSAGNEYFEFDGNVDGVGVVRSPQNANIPEENNSLYIMVVGATNADGLAAGYSNTGSNIWVSAPGGEDGDIDPGIMTTDLQTCAQGYVRSTDFYDYNRFETFSTSDSIFLNFNPSCHYTSTMQGTSAAAPNVSGVAALLLSANPRLSWRDVRHILAITADRVHETAGNSVHYQAALNLDDHVYEQGWVKNRADVFFHNWYGFGRVNAQRAVAMALDPSYGPLPPWFEANPDFEVPSLSRSSLALAVPDNSATGVTDSLLVNLGSEKVIESVQVKLNLTHPRSGEIGVELTSPGGTKSILLNINNALLLPLNGGPSDADLDVVLTTHAFYGESTNGTWTLKLIDGLGGGQTGVLNSWSLNILGH